MSDQPVGPFFDVSGRRIKDGPAPRAAEVAAAVRAALDLPAEAWQPTVALAEPRITGTACFELHPLAPIQIPLLSAEPAPELDSGPAVIQIEATVDLNAQSTYPPYRMLAVSLSGNICQPLATEWELTDGFFFVPQQAGSNTEPVSFSIQVQRVRLGNQQVAAEEPDFTSCATSFFAISHRYFGPDSWLGIFSFENFIWTCNILFKGWQACS
jgi:hypothetical protein